MGSIIEITRPWIISVVRPDREAPLFRSDKVGMVVLNPKIVVGRELPRQAKGRQLNPFRSRRREFVANLQIARRGPALVLQVKWVFGRRADLLAADRQLEDDP